MATRRREVTDFQKVVLFFAGVVSIFLAAMALGGRNPWWLVASVAVLGIAAAGVAVSLSRRGGAGGHEIVTARVISASAPPANAVTKARCDMRLMVFLPGRGRVETRLRDPAVPLHRWPEPGQTYPVNVYAGNPHRRLHIRWDLVEQGITRSPTASGEGGPAQQSAWDEDDQPLVVSPTPPRPRRSASRTSPQPTSPATSAGAPAVHLFEEFTDLEGNPLPGPPAGPHPARPAPGGYPDRPESNGHDPYGLDLADFEEPRIESVALPDFDPADVDRLISQDFGWLSGDETPARRPGGEPPSSPAPSPPAPADLAEPAGPAEPAVTAEPADHEDAAPAGAQAPLIPTPRPEPPAKEKPALEKPALEKAAPIVRRGDPARGGTGLDASLPVADLARSLHFYRENLGLTVAYTASDSAVVEGAGTRILLEHVGEPPGLRPRPETIHLHVADIEAAVTAWRARGVEFLEPTDSAGARLRDPDGHEIVVIERGRDG